MKKNIQNSYSCTGNLFLMPSVQFMWQPKGIPSESWQIRHNLVCLSTPNTTSNWVNRICFKDSWFVFHESSWSFQKPYFSRKHIFDELHWVNRTQYYGLKTCKQVPNYSVLLLFQKHSYQWFPASSIFLLSKSFVNFAFYGAGKNKLKRQDKFIQTFIFYLIYSGKSILLEKHFVRLCNTRKFNLSSIIEMCHFEEFQ